MLSFVLIVLFAGETVLYSVYFASLSRQCYEFGRKSKRYVFVLPDFYVYVVDFIYFSRAKTFFIACAWKSHNFHLILPPSKIENSLKC
jgi:hypothetical protein